MELDLFNLAADERIKDSEIQVLKSLDYQLNFLTPFNCIESLLEILGVCIIELKQLIKFLFVISNKLIECFYYYRDEVYDYLFEAITGLDRTQKDR